MWILIIAMVVLLAVAMLVLAMAIGAGTRRVEEDPTGPGDKGFEPNPTDRGYA